jgi:hypothetical protein
LPGGGGEFVIDGVLIAPGCAAGLDGLAHHVAVHIIFELMLFILLQPVGGVGDVK